MVEKDPHGYRLVSLSGGGYRAALFGAGSLRALHTAGLLVDRNVIVNSVSGGTIAAALWRKYLRSNFTKASPTWPEASLLCLVDSTPKRGGQFNWQLRGAWFGATERWHDYLEKWWDDLEPLPEGLGHEPQILIEALDYHSGQLWLYDRTFFCPATRDFLKTRKGFRNLSVSTMYAVATASSFPIAFQGLTAEHEWDEGGTIRLQDAGLVDNLAMMPLLRILEHDSDGKPLGPVKEWILSDAGKPLAVTSRAATLESVGYAQTVNSLGLFDRISRLTGDLAQPLFVKLIAQILSDYADVQFVATSIGLTIGEDEPWLPADADDVPPSRMPTTLSFVPRRVALAAIAEGAQSMSKALAHAGLMTAEQRIKVREFIVALAE